MARSLVRQILEGARILVGARATWTRNYLALTANNRECEPTDARAARFCAYGALIRSAYDLTGCPIEARTLAGRAAMHITGRDSPDEAFEHIYSINDGPPVSSRKAVMRMLDSTLERV